MGVKFKSFINMATSLRAGAASGMNSEITLEPDSAIHLAKILEAHEANLLHDITTPDTVDPEEAAHDWPDVPDTPEQRSLIEKHNADIRDKYPNLRPSDTVEG